MLSLLLTNCATPSSPDIHAARPPPEVCAAVQLEPRLPDDAGIPVAVTDPERVATASFLAWVAQLGDWGRAMKGRADKTVAWCAKT